MSNIDQPEIKKYRFTVFFFITVGIILLTIFVLAAAFRRLDVWDFLVCAGGVLLFVCGLLQWLKYSRGEVLFTERRLISLQMGEFAFDEPFGAYDLWMFCEIPFSRYHGNIYVAKEPSKDNKVLKVPRRNPWLWRPRSDVAPIIVKLNGDGAGTKTRCLIKFDLRPTFTGTVFKDIYSTHEVESVTVMLKTRA